MNRRTFGAVAGAIALLALSSSAGAQANVSAAVADSNRPADDTARDAARKPADTLAFAKVRPGQTVLEIAPGGGYFTRLLSKAVGPTGHVYSATPPQFAKAVTAIAADPAYSNVTVVGVGSQAMTAVPKVDLVFTAQNYHDLHNPAAKLDVPALDKAWFDQLKPGGLFVVVDHVATTGASVPETASTLHRIDPAFVRKEVESAGFVFDGEANFLHNPADTHALKVFDPSIRGHTDQFVFRFRKPA
ncbi:MAG TPA: methyltransferase [Caulobacteraceae bacterium]|jgi:predicted methyltransferase